MCQSGNPHHLSLSFSTGFSRPGKFRAEISTHSHSGIEPQLHASRSQHHGIDPKLYSKSVGRGCQMRYNLSKLNSWNYQTLSTNTVINRAYNNCGELYYGTYISLILSPK